MDIDDERYIEIEKMVEAFIFQEFNVNMILEEKIIDLSRKPISNYVISICYIHIMFNLKMKKFICYQYI